MNTIIIEHVDNNTTELLQNLFERMGLSAKIKAEEGSENSISNPAIIKAIEEYEKGETGGKIFSVPELKTAFDKMLSNA